MSRLQLLILWVLAIGAGFFYFKSKDVPESIDTKTNLEIGAPLLPPNSADTIDGFTVKKGEDTVTLKKLEGGWVVSEKGDFPANTTSVTRVIEALRESKVAQGVVASDEFFDRFELDPEAENEGERPDTISLMKGGEETAVLFLGKTRQSTGGSGGTAGRFVRLSSDNSGVYITQESFAFLGANPDNWIEKVLTPLEEGTIKMEVTAPNDETFKAWTISRKTVMDDFIVEGLGEKEETKTNETGTLKNIFSRTTFVELIDEEDFKERADEKGVRQLKATDSAGSTFLITITPEKKKEEEEKDADAATPTPAVNFIVTIEILNGPTIPEPVAADASPQEKAVYEQRVANLEGLSKSIKRMRKTYEGRYFVVNMAAIGSLTKNRGEFIQPKKEEKKPVSVTTKPIPVPTPGEGSNVIPGTGGPSSPPPGIARPKEDKPKKPKIEAVTPPIRVPPMPKKDQPKPGETAETKPKPAPTPPPLPGSKPGSTPQDSPKPAPASGDETSGEGPGEGSGDQ